ncbi:Polyketide cyclase/dehydrase [Corchorus capsularis]|uniref:Polyketide cyclase/dehydrase n=1 Tax=Corchorus capsularis TaxID=210143 RepID=A0A1R3IJA4_COCAP|nr:Polyketide cyclase/dehydrase [Corchorus capsularis]
MANSCDEQKQSKWQGKALVELEGAKAEQIWPLLQDFFGLDKWFPTLSTCLPVEGVSGQPGCVRYSIVDGNVGFNSYVSTVKVSAKGEGCQIEWKYEVEPVNGWTLEDLDFFIGSGLKVMAQRMEAALQVFQASMNH